MNPNLEQDFEYARKNLERALKQRYKRSIADRIEGFFDSLMAIPKLILFLLIVIVLSPLIIFLLIIYTISEIW